MSTRAATSAETALTMDAGTAINNASCEVFVVFHADQAMPSVNTVTSTAVQNTTSALRPRT